MNYAAHPAAFIFILSVIFLAVLGPELRAPHVLGKGPTTGATLLAVLCWLLYMYIAWAGFEPQSS
jgi:hypothetical protein